MPSISYGLSSYERIRGDFPALPVVNMFAEQAPTEKNGIALLSRPGLTDRSASMGSGPVQALFQRDNVLSTALFGVSGAKLYRATTLIGALNGSGPFFMAGYQTNLFVAGGGSLWGYDGTTLAAIAFPDGASVRKCIVGASRLIALRADTQQYYFTQALATSIDALNFESAESQPDRLLDMLFIDGVLVLFGAETVEFHAATTNADLPFQPIEARAINRGIRGTGCAAQIGETFAWVTNVNQVCVTTADNIISNPGLEERIEASTDVSLFTFFIGGVEFLALRLDTETQVYSTRSGTWHEFASYGQSNWIPQCYAGGVFGSSLDGTTLEWGDDYTDLGGQLERRWRFGYVIDSGGQTISNLNFRINVGQTPYLTGEYTDPQIEVRLSRTAGQTWGDWKQTSLGEQGNYRQKVQFRGLGQAAQPGFFGEARVTAPIPLRVSDCLVNEQWGGR